MKDKSITGTCIINIIVIPTPSSHTEADNLSSIVTHEIRSIHRVHHFLWVFANLQIRSHYLRFLRMTLS